MKEIVNKDPSPTQQIILQLPNDFPGEEAFLGQLIEAGSQDHKEFDKAIWGIENVIPASDFGRHLYNPVHTAIYNLIFKNYSKARPISVSDLSGALSREKYFQNDIAAVEVFLENLQRNAALPKQIGKLTKSLLDLSIKRQLIQLSQNLIDEININVDALDSLEYVAKIEKQLSNLIVYSEYNHDSYSIINLLSEVEEKIKFNMKNSHKLIGLTTGFNQLNKLLGGMQNSDLIILAARPAMGKTALALCIALNAAEYLRDNSDEVMGSVGFFSLEMSGVQLVSRLISMKSKVGSIEMRSGNISDSQLEKITLAGNNLRDLNIVIDDNAAISMVELRSKVRRMTLKNKLSVIFIDYLQLLSGSKKSSNDSRVNEISEISRGLKQIAKELNIPVIALSQLSRDIEKRENKTPQLSDLRESGSIEQDADIVMFLHREEYYLKQPESGTEEHHQWSLEKEAKRNKAKIIIAKHRNGPVGEVEIRFDHNTTSFFDPSQYSEEEFFKDAN